MSAQLKRAHELLESASIVCFLGFSYHPLNLKKLNHTFLSGKSKNGNVGVHLHGTAFQMPSGPQRSANRRFDGELTLEDREWDILKFLQETPYIHG